MLAVLKRTLSDESKTGPNLGHRRTAAETKNDLMRKINRKSEKKDGGRYGR